MRCYLYVKSIAIASEPGGPPAWSASAEYALESEETGQGVAPAPGDSPGLVSGFGTLRAEGDTVRPVLEAAVTERETAVRAGVALTFTWLGSVPPT